MANVYAVKSGNWSDTTVWNTGALPTSADDVYANNFVVNVDTSPTVLTVRTTTGTGIAAGGRFELQNGVTLTCTATVGVLQGTTTPVVFSLASPNAATLNAGLLPGRSGASSLIAQVTLSGTGTLNTSGNIAFNSSATGNAPAINVSGTGAILNHTGDVNAARGGTPLNSNAINVTGTGAVINITGNLINRPDFSGSSSSAVIQTQVNCSVNVTGNVSWAPLDVATGGQRSAIYVTGGTTTAVVTGTVSGADLSNTTATLTVSGTLTVIGTVNGGQTGVAISQTNLFLTGPLVASTSGIQPVLSSNWRWYSTLTPTYYAVRNFANNGYRYLYTSDNASSGSGQPATTNVRSGTVYGPSNEFTGTCAVPSASQVAFGVAVDNTTGTATLTAANVRAAIGLASANLDSQISAIPTTAAPTAAAIRAEMDANSMKLANLDATVSSRSTYAGADTSGTTTLLSRLTATRAGNLDSLDATISSRLAASSYITPPTVAQIRTEMDTNSTKLVNLDSTVSSRLAASSYTAPLDATGTRSAVGLSSANLDTQLSNLSSGQTTINNNVSTRLASASYTAPPTALENSSAVRTELSPELGRIDATISSRFASIDYTAPPSSSANASAVRTELSPELNRIDAAVSSRLANVDYTAPLDAAETRSAIGLNSANLDIQLDSLPTALENASAIRTELSPELGRIDATVSSRLAPDGTLARVTLTDTATTLTNAPTVPTPEEIATQVRTELTTELDRIDTTVSSRLAEANYTEPPTVNSISTAVQAGILDESDGQAILEAIVNAIGNQNVDQIALVAAIRADLERIDGILNTRLAAADYTTPPTAEENASAIRTELAPELSHIDSDISSRLASADYTTPPTTTENAAAVRAELTPELARVSNASTTQEVADIIEGSLG